ncbi:MAG TPA: diaminopimelate epimerase [Thermodesulfobacteriota bacterium]|nr:diaminopimelate epimerase [Thermodesulfobacteriota bacterium]
MKIPFSKMNGSGNDFIVIDNRAKIVDADRCSEFVQRVCTRKFSVGADGLILIESSKTADFRWRFFNSDGSEAEMCGNGGRCAARFAFLHKIAPAKLKFETLAGMIEAEVSGRTVKLQMVKPKGLKLNLEVPIDGRSHRVHFVNTGVPHAVRISGSGDEPDVKELGRKIRHHQVFQPAGTNANFLRPVDRRRIEVRTYERGVEDETLACGTGAVASALIAAALGLADSPVDVRTTGGEILRIHFDGQGPEFDRVFLEGDTRLVYQGELWEEAYKD